MNITNPDPEQYAAALGGTVYIRFNRGVIRGTGADRLDLLHRLSTNATRDLAAGEETTTILTSDKGRVIEVVRVIALDDHILMLLSGGDTEQVRAWLEKYTIMDDFATSDATSGYVVAGVYGDHAKSLVAGVLDQRPPDAGKVARGRFQEGEVMILRDLRLTGAGGFLLVIDATVADALLARLAEGGAREIGEETYETLRIEAGSPAIGRELTEAYNPLEAGLTQFISFTKGCYIGQEVIARLDSYDKVQRHLVGLSFPGSLEARNGGALDLVDAGEGKRVGAITSIAYSPSLGRTIALAYVRTSFAVPGATVDVVPEGAESGPIATASITKLPFDR